MKAKLIVPLAGDPMMNIGDEVSGDEAIRLCEAGFAVPVVDPVVEEDAAPVLPEKREKAVAKRVAKETR